MGYVDAGVPPVAFAQLIASGAIAPAAAREFRSLMTLEGVDEATMIHGNIQAPLRWFLKVYPDLDAGKATELGLAFARQSQLTSFGALSVPLVSAGSVAEVIELLTYLPLISTAISPVFHPTADGLNVGLTGHTGDHALDCLAVVYCGSAVLRLVDMLVDGLPTIPLHLDWPRPGAPGDGPYADSYGGLVFGEPTSFLHIPSEVLVEVCRFSDPVAYRIAISDLQQALALQQGTASVSATVRRLLSQTPEKRNSEWVADQLSISVSTLKRRIQEEGTTFRALRESCLHEHAVLRLLDRSVTVSQIGRELGYSDLTNFSHAFKQWTGKSPTQFRSDQRVLT